MRLCVCARVHVRVCVIICVCMTGGYMSIYVWALCVGVYVYAQVRHVCWYDERIVPMHVGMCGYASSVCVGVCMCVRASVYVCV